MTVIPSIKLDISVSVDYTERACMEALLKTNEVCELVGISRQHLTRLVKKRLFPKPVYISVRSPRWQQKDIDKYIEDKK